MAAIKSHIEGIEDVLHWNFYDPLRNQKKRTKNRNTTGLNPAFWRSPGLGAEAHRADSSWPEQQSSSLVLSQWGLQEATQALARGSQALDLVRPQATHKVLLGRACSFPGRPVQLGEHCYLNSLCGLADEVALPPAYPGHQVGCAQGYMGT